VGFCVIVLLTAFLKYSFIYAYLPSLYFSGLVDLLLITAFSLTLSLFAGTVVSARYLIVFSALTILLLKAATGFYGILSNRVTMQVFGNLFDLNMSAFVAISGALLILCVAFSAFRAGSLAKYYVVNDAELARLAEGTIRRLDAGAGLPSVAKQRRERRLKLFNAIFTTVAVLFICLVLLFNVLIILLSTATPGNEITIRGIIPYIFQSDTMQPDIMYNDLTYFKRVDSQYPVTLGQIVLFQQDNLVYVERIIEISGQEIKVDIDNYPPLSETGVMIKTVDRSAIYGIFDGSNRWLGALILFSNTIVGRLLFLLVPIVLLFFKPQVLRFIQKRH
jgi:hypothetical protein